MVLRLAVDVLSLTVRVTEPKEFESVLSIVLNLSCCGSEPNSFPLLNLSCRVSHSELSVVQNSKSF